MPRNRLYRLRKAHHRSQPRVGARILGNTIGNAVAGGISSENDTSAQAQQSPQAAPAGYYDNDPLLDEVAAAYGTSVEPASVVLSPAGPRAVLVGTAQIPDDQLPQGATTNIVPDWLAQDGTHWYAIPLETGAIQWGYYSPPQSTNTSFADSPAVASTPADTSPLLQSIMDQPVNLGYDNGIVCTTAPPSQDYMLGDGSVFTGTPTELGNYQQQQADQAYLGAVTGSTFGGIALGVSHEMGASPATQDLFYGLGSAADGLALSGAALSGGSIGPFTGQNSLDIVNAENGTHGNSRSSARTTFLYQLQTQDGQFLKYGVSINPATRYTKSFMADKIIDRIASGTRADMLDLERQMVTANPGQLNNEPWAKKARGGN